MDLFDIPELLLHIAKFIPNDTFYMSRVCVRWNKILEDNFNNMIFDINYVQNDSYMLSMCIKKYNICGYRNIVFIVNNVEVGLKIYKIISPNCLNIIANYAGKRKDMNICYIILGQYCEINCNFKNHHKNILKMVQDNENYNVSEYGYIEICLKYRAFNNIRYLILWGSLYFKDNISIDKWIYYIQHNAQTKNIDDIIEELKFIIDNKLINILSLHNSMRLYVNNGTMRASKNSQNEYFNRILEFILSQMDDEMKNCIKITNYPEFNVDDVSKKIKQY